MILQRYSREVAADMSNSDPATVYYLHFGYQCPGKDYMAQGAREAAAKLQRQYLEVDIMAEPEYAERYNSFYPGLVVIDEMRCPWPAKGEELLYIHETGETLPGEYTPANLEVAEPQEIVALTPELGGDAACICNPSGSQQKAAWFQSMADRGAGSTLGFMALDQGQPVAVVEFLPGNLIPYPYTDKRASDLIVTCLHSDTKTKDYRPALVRKMIAEAPGMGFRRIRVAAGLETPYPNGPVSFFEEFGFETQARLDRMMLKKRWDEMFEVRLNL